jgi:hypothetical protein
MKNEKGQAVVIALVIVAFGGLVITPFLGHASSDLMGVQHYETTMTEQYAGDAGVEHAIWRLKYDGLADELSGTGNSTEYQLDEAVNGVAPVDITVVKTGETTYEITSAAAGETIQATVEMAGDNVSIRQWDIN